VRHVTLTGEAPELIERLTAGRSPGDVLFKRDDGRAWKRAEQLRAMREACRRAAIEPAVGFHVLRHTHASILAMQAVPMAVIARQLGHADTRMTERHYTHLAPNYVADTIRASFPRLAAISANPDRHGPPRTSRIARRQPLVEPDASAPARQRRDRKAVLLQTISGLLGVVPPCAGPVQQIKK
jgi:Phage integrase family